MEAIKLGCEIYHIVTGISGIAAGRSESLNGTVQYSIKQQDFDKANGRNFDDIWVDEGLIQYKGTGLLSDKQFPEPTVTDIQLGQTVEHISGFKGVAMERVTYINGCVLFGVLPKTKDPNVLPEMQFLASQYLKTKPVKPVKSERDPNGGPSSKAPSL